MVGKIVYELPPSAENRRNSEGAFITLKDGGILYIYTRFSSAGWADHAEADLYGICSRDGGETFGEPFPVLLHEQVQADNVMSASLIRLDNGDIGLFFGAKKGATRCVYCMVRSRDEGKTWSAPVHCSENDGYYVVHNDRAIRSGSRILIPTSFHPTETLEGNVRYFPGILQIFASDDDGFTWKTLPGKAAIPVSAGCTTGVQEPGLVEKDGDTRWCFIRNNSGRQYESFSRDGGESWSAPLPSGFTAPESPMSMKRLRDGRLLAVWNPIPMYNGRAVADGIWARTPLVMAVSHDNRESFSTPVTLDEEPGSAYGYTAIHETDDGSVLLAYCAGSTKDECMLNRLRIRKISPEEI